MSEFKFDNPSYPLWKAGYDAGYAAGAEAMRERAIEVCEAGIDPMLPDMYETACRTSLSLIRALPITQTNTEGEQA